jgi:hypothetical protein
MNKAIHYYCISYDAGEDLPYGFAWFVNIGNGPHDSGFDFYATHAECIARTVGHRFYTNPVALEDDSPEAMRIAA